MSDAAANYVGVVIILLMLVFLGIWVWAWLPHHKKNFEFLARLPMLDLAPGQGPQKINATLVASDAGVASEGDNR
jgi:cytochrome c oxidase cbb3-type subunit 4